MTEQTATAQAKTTVTTNPNQGGLLQRQCACGTHTTGGGECPACSKKKFQLQRKLNISATDDPLELEADRVADQLMAMPAHAEFSNIAPRIQRYTGQASRKLDAAPTSVEQVLASPGRPLEPSLQQDMEQRFSYDFSHVRTHTGTTAQQSARDVNAHAYTVGHNIVFGAGKFSPNTQTGRRLLAHELTHVVQQTCGEANGSSFTSSSPILARAWNSCGAAQDCPQRESGEQGRTASVALEVGALDSPEVGEIISHFGIGSSSVRGLASNSTWQNFVRLLESEGSHWEILGFSDCEGSDAENVRLRQHRAGAILRALPSTASAKVDRTAGAPLVDCVAPNDTEVSRSLNRSVVFRRTVTMINFPGETISVRPPRFVCGPDVTSQVEGAVRSIGNTFTTKWNSDQKENACDALDNAIDAQSAWDIVQLHNKGWISQNYQPTCATTGAVPHCGSSVQVGSDCYYSGSVNYVIFGKMCKLCADYYLGIPLINTGYARFTKSAMNSLINLYKGTGVTGFATPAPNFSTSVAWADAGYDGWPGSSAPPGDRNNCAPMCPLPFSGSFSVHWYPNQSLETTVR